ncbi:MAG: hypothetical protein IPK80_19425 [Nannocystis sp.]|nr:hypothetical protein [Nannocystis sp.]
MSEDPSYTECAARLLALIAHDDEVRARLAADGSLFDGYHPEMEAVHRSNAAQLREVVARVGWPGRSKVGDAAANAAWRIVQHAIGEPVFLRAMLPIIAADPDTPPAEVAMLEDRIRVFEGRLQRYGTQFDWNDEGTALVPMGGVEDPETVDERRATAALPPIVWRREPADGERPPRDPAAKQREAEAWLRRVGWR